jgi:hypothetical protein
MVSAEKQNSRKLYEPPVLTVYGKVHDVTQKVGSAHSLDGGRLPKVRTAAF